MSFIADTPWWISLIVVIVGVAILLGGKRGIGAGIAGVGLLLLVLGLILDSPRKAVERSTKQFVESVSAANWTDVEGLLDPAVSWEWPGQPWHANGAPAVLAGAKMVYKNAGLKGANVKQPTIKEVGDGAYTNDCICWITSDSTGGMPVDSEWQFSWKLSATDSKWKLMHLKVSRVGDAAPSGIKSSLDKH